MEAVAGMMGIRKVDVEHSEITITYDLLEATAEQIERKLLETGARLGTKWKERIRRSFVHYTEDCQAANMEVTGRGHHSHP